MKSKMREHLQKTDEATSKNVEMQLHYAGEFKGEIKFDDVP